MGRAPSANTLCLLRFLPKGFATTLLIVVVVAAAIEPDLKKTQEKRGKEAAGGDKVQRKTFRGQMPRRGARAAFCRRTAWSSLSL